MADNKEPPKDDSTIPDASGSITHDWLDPGTWSSKHRNLPFYVGFAAVLLGVLYSRFIHVPEVDLSSYASCVGSFDYTFRVNAVSTQAHDLSQQGREIGMAYEATMQMYNPERSVFAHDPFPGGKLPSLGMRMDEAALYARKKVNVLGDSLSDEHDDSTSGPATMGVAALMLAQRWSKDYMPAATRQKDILLEQAPRHSNGAISHRLKNVEIRSEAIGMFAPLLAYYGVATGNLSVIQEAVRQCRLYRDVLLIRNGSTKGLWQHVAGPSPSAKPWSSGNAWAAYGMSRISATIAGWPESNIALSKEKNELDDWIREIIDGVIRTDTDPSQLLKNYLGESDWDGEILARPSWRPQYIEWCS